MESSSIENISKVKSLEKNLITFLRTIARSFKLECNHEKEEFRSKPTEAILLKHDKVRHEVQAKLRSYLFTR